MKKHKTGIVLSGGGAKGYAHIGALMALEERGIEPTAVAGTSMGAIIGIFYAAGYRGKEIYDIVVKEKFDSLFTVITPVIGISKLGLSSHKNVYEVFRKYMPDDDFDRLPKPLTVCATDLITSEGRYFSSGKHLHDAVIASSSIPGVFEAVKIGDGIYVDGTLGGGGHSYEIARRLDKGGKLIGIDRDEDALRAASERLSEFSDRVKLIRGNYEDMVSILHDQGIFGADGILLDLGVSSYQFDEAERGFSYKKEAPLDMRMDRREKRTAADIINGYTESELYRIIRDYGEDRFAKNIAKHIVNERQKKPIETTTELAEIIKHAIPARVREVGGHPANKTFQAIRIELYSELDILSGSIE